jgi:hypothetical protein
VIVTSHHLNHFPSLRSSTSLVGQFPLKSSFDSNQKRVIHWSSVSQKLKRYNLAVSKQRNSRHDICEMVRCYYEPVFCYASFVSEISTFGKHRWSLGHPPAHWVHLLHDRECWDSSHAFHHHRFNLQIPYLRHDRARIPIIFTTNLPDGCCSSVWFDILPHESHCFCIVSRQVFRTTHFPTQKYSVGLSSPTQKSNANCC